jgi:VIT1/CCC1 family predicted Fe2+/Mn2+ transporter
MNVRQMNGWRSPREAASVAAMPRHTEKHLVARIGWLRAAVLGANDGIVSTASLIIGVAAAGQPRADILLAGAAGLVAGAMSMAAGEYVSVSSQGDTERSELAQESAEILADPAAEHAELKRIYQGRGLDAATADTVATQLMAHDAIGAHARDELGITDISTARPVQAAMASALSFTVGAALPLGLVLLLPEARLALGVGIGSLAFLALLGVVGAKAGGAPWLRATVRVTFWGALAMAATAGIGRLVGAVV